MQAILEAIALALKDPDRYQVAAALNSTLLSRAEAVEALRHYFEGEGDFYRLTIKQEQTAYHLDIHDTWDQVKRYSFRIARTR